MNNLLRELHDNKDVIDSIAKYVAAMAIVAALTVLIIAWWAMYQTMTTADAETYRQELLQKEADPDWQAEQRRLRQKHGDRTVIFEMGQEPYFIDESGKRCRYI